MEKTQKKKRRKTVSDDEEDSCSFITYLGSNKTSGRESSICKITVKGTNKIHIHAIDELTNQQSISI